MPPDVLTMSELKMISQLTCPEREHVAIVVFQVAGLVSDRYAHFPALPAIVPPSGGRDSASGLHCPDAGGGGCCAQLPNADGGRAC